MAHRVGIIGAGDIARKTFLPLLAERKDCELAAICSRTPGPARELATEYGIEQVYDDLHSLLERSDIDTVFVCTPTETHLTIAQAALKQSKNVLIEKPLTTIYEDDVSLLKLARLQSKTFYVAFNNYFREENRWLSRQVLAGTLGRVQIIELEWYRAQPFPSGGVLMHLGAKLFHFALSLIPERRSFTAICQNVQRSGESATDEDTSTSSVVIDGKVSINMRLAWDIVLPVDSRVNLDVFGENGGVSNRDYKGTQSDGYENMIGEFLEKSGSGEPMDLDLVEDTLTLLNALYRSHRIQAVVSGNFA